MPLSDQPIWYLNALFYEIYVRAYYDSNGDGNGDLAGVAQKLDHLKDLGVDCLWLSPIYPSPRKDDGYDIADFTAVHPDYGSLDDFRLLIDEAHRRGLRVILDLVLNHTSDQHPWFQAARSDRDSPYRDYYTWSDSDELYSEARIIFLDTEKSNWTWDEVAGQYFWHRFYSSQPDLNYDNPAVQQVVLDVARFWLDLGVDGFRADAVPYLFEREGTNCENLPETHLFLKRLRAFMDECYPGRVLLCEANQWPRDVRAYFGEGDEFHMAFHFPLMPRVFKALRRQEVAPLVWVFEQTPPIPPGCQWCTFLRNHDELTLEMVNPEDREWMWQEYAPEPRMRLNLGIRRRLAPLLNNDRAQIELANSLLFTLPGAPVLYYGDEIGMGDDIWLTDRNGLRTPMQWEAGGSAGFSPRESVELYAPVIATPGYTSEEVNVADQRADPGSLLNTIRHMIAVRKAHLAFNLGDMAWVDAGDPALAVYWRRLGGQHILVAQNLAAEEREVVVPLAEVSSLRDLLADEGVPLQDGVLRLILPARGYRWMLREG